MISEIKKIVPFLKPGVAEGIVGLTSDNFALCGPAKFIKAGRDCVYSGIALALIGSLAFIYSSNAAYLMAGKVVAILGGGCVLLGGAVMHRHIFYFKPHSGSNQS